MAGFVSSTVMGAGGGIAFEKTLISRGTPGGAHGDEHRHGEEDRQERVARLLEVVEDLADCEIPVARASGAQFQGLVDLLPALHGARLYQIDWTRLDQLKGDGCGRIIWAELGQVARSRESK